MHQLGQRLARLSADLLVEALPTIAAAGPGREAERLSRLQVRAQGEVGLNYARMLTKEDALIDWGATALAIHRQVMGLYPGAHTSWRGKRLKLLATEPLVARLADGLSAEARALLGGPTADAPPGSVLAIVPGVGVVLASGGCPLLLRQAQLEGKAAAQGQSLIQQLEARPGDRLGDGA